MSKRERGFTIIELLVLIAVVEIVAAVAIPQFSAFRTRSFNARAETELRNTLSAEEAYFAYNASYLACSSIGMPCEELLPGLKSTTPGVRIHVSARSTGLPIPEILVRACHDSGDTLFIFDESRYAPKPGVIVGEQIPATSTCLNQLGG